MGARLGLVHSEGGSLAQRLAHGDRLGSAASPQTTPRARAPLTVAIARAYRSMESQLHAASRRRCQAALTLANRRGTVTESRQRRILEALADTRSALQETLRIDFGERFRLELSVTDLEGWPKIELHLLDLRAEFLPGIHGTVKDTLSASAVERSSAGILFIAFNHHQVVAQLPVDESTELETLPEVLVEQVSQFLWRARESSAPTASESSPPNVDPLQRPVPVSSAEKRDLDATLLDLNFISDE